MKSRSAARKTAPKSVGSPPKKRRGKENQAKSRKVNHSQQPQAIKTSPGLLLGSTDGGAKLEYQKSEAKKYRGTEHPTDIYNRLIRNCKNEHQPSKTRKTISTKRIPMADHSEQSEDDAYLSSCENVSENPSVCKSGSLQALRQLANKKGIPLSGNKLQLQQRLQWYDKYNLNSSIIQPVDPIRALDCSEFAEDLSFMMCDDVLRNSLGWLSVVQVFSYFKHRSALQGYRKGKLLKKAGFLRNVSYAKVNSETYQIRCYCAATMHKNRLYQVKLEHNGRDITKANCKCPAGSGNSAACKHIGALLDALQQFVKDGTLPQNTTCTDVLQTWHRPPKSADKSLSYKPIKVLFPEPKSAVNFKIDEVTQTTFTEYFLKTTLNAGLHMAVHRSRYVKDMANYYEEHSYAKSKVPARVDGSRGATRKLARKGITINNKELSNRMRNPRRVTRPLGHTLMRSGNQTTKIM